MLLPDELLELELDEVDPLLELEVELEPVQNSPQPVAKSQPPKQFSVLIVHGQFSGWLKSQISESPPLLEVELELLDDDVLELPPPLQPGNTKEPSWLPWSPKVVPTPGCKLPFQPTSPAVTVLPETERSAFQLPVTCGASSNSSATSQLLMGVPLLLVTLTSNW